MGALICHIRIFLWLALFSLPVLAAIWDEKLDQELAKPRYLPPLRELALVDD